MSDFLDNLNNFSSEVPKSRKKQKTFQHMDNCIRDLSARCLITILCKGKYPCTADLLFDWDSD